LLLRIGSEFGHRRDELVTAAVERLDDPLLARIVAQRTAGFVHRASQCRFGDVLACPEPLQQLVLADDTRAMLDEIDDELEHARLDANGLAAHEQAIAGRIDFALLEAIADSTRRGT